MKHPKGCFFGVEIQLIRIGDSLYSELVEEYSKIRPSWRKVKPLPQSWLNYGAGKSGLQFTWSFKSNNLYIDTGDGNENERIFENLERHKEKIEKELKSLTWERLEEKRACRICIYKNIRANIRTLKEEDYLKIVKWSVETMKNFSEVFSRYIEKL
ncbi:MAG: DUF4268 domain-containing protein [Patescibacteria group bacterium]|nr:DUF4268 domain-containing protein [Patescibacteria group bacterium]